MGQKGFKMSNYDGLLDTLDKLTRQAQKLRKQNAILVKALEQIVDDNRLDSVDCFEIAANALDAIQK